MLLLYRANRAWDEDFYSYYRRVLYWNGFGGEINPFVIFRKLWKTKINFLKNHHSNNVFALEYLLKRHVVHVDEKSFVSNSYPDNSTCNICPNCWENLNYLRIYWLGEDYKRCHVHNIHLRRVNNFYFGISPAEIKRKRKVKGENNPFLIAFIEKYEIFQEKHYSYLSLYHDEQTKLKVEMSIIETLAYICSDSNIEISHAQGFSYLSRGNLIGLNVEASLNKIFSQLSPDPVIQEFIKITTALIILDKGKTKQIGLIIEGVEEFYLWARDFILASVYLNVLRKVFYLLNEQFLSTGVKPNFGRGKFRVERFFTQYELLPETKRVLLSKIVFRLVFKAVLPNKNMMYRYEKPLLEEISDNYINIETSVKFYKI